MSEEVIVVGLFDFLLVINEREENFMGFVFEKVPENDMEFLKSMRLKDCWGINLLNVDEDTEWCVDRERNAYLIGIGGGYREMPHYYDFCWSGQVIRIEAECRGIGNYGVGVGIVWYIHRIPMSKECWQYKDEILKMITEAFGVNRDWCDEKCLKSITVKIMCEIEMLEE